MKIKSNIFYGFLFALLAVSCIKDEGNYTYNEGNVVTIRHPAYSYTGFLGDTTTVYATRTFSDPTDTTNFDHIWYINGEVYSREPVLKFVSTAIGSFSGRYYMIDRKTGIYMISLSGFTINVSSPFQNGWSVLYEKDGKSELAHIRVTGGVYFDYTDVYKTNNNGEELGSQPIKIKDYPVTGGRGMFVAQKGGQGSVELNGNSMKKQLVVNNTFVGGSAPTGFTPVDMGFYATADMLVNENGDVYARYFQNPIAFTVPWLAVPMKVSRGMKIKDIWDNWAASMAYTFMYDELNNRVLYVRLDAPNITGGVAVVDSLPALALGTVLPAGYINPNRLGNWQYIWGGVFNDTQYAGDGAMLLRDPSNQQIRYESFSSRSENRVLSWLPKVNISFPGSSLITPASKFVAIKSREYLFFTGGANNTDLYYFDIKSGTIVKLYKSFSSPIQVITASDDSNQLAVGLEDGTFILYDISNQAIIDGTTPELHRLAGLGKVVDITVKGGNMR